MLRKIALCTAIACAVASLPLKPAEAHGYHRGGFGLLAAPFIVGAAVVGAAAAIATAPVREVAAAPVYAAPPVIYAPPPVAYAPPGYAYGYPYGYYRR